MVYPIMFGRLGYMPPRFQNQSNLDRKTAKSKYIRNESSSKSFLLMRLKYQKFINVQKVKLTVMPDSERKSKKRTLTDLIHVILTKGSLTL